MLQKPVDLGYVCSVCLSIFCEVWAHASVVVLAPSLQSVEDSKIFCLIIWSRVTDDELVPMLQDVSGCATCGTSFNAVSKPTINLA